MILSIIPKGWEWLNRPKWPNRLIFYLIILFVVIIFSRFILTFFGFLHTDGDSARYMLSALIQSEATILAIVITLSLVAVQLAASSYSARIIDLFKNNPDFWILIVIYAIAIIYGLGVLKQINSFSSLENYILSSYYLGIFALVALIPYILNTLKQLKPSTTIKMLAEKITKQNITVPDENGPLQLVIDIVRGSLMKYDYETVRDGLETISECIGNIFKNYTFSEDEDFGMSFHVFSHLRRIANIAVSNKDENSLLELILSIDKVGRIAAEQKLKYAIEGAANSLKLIGEKAIKNGFEYYLISSSEKSLEIIGTVAAENDVEYGTKSTLVSLQKIGELAAKQKNKDAIRQAAISLKKIGMSAAKKNLEDAVIQTASSLGDVGIAAAEQKLEETRLLAKCLEELGIAVSQSQLLDPTVHIILSLEEIGIKSIEQELDDATTQAVESLGTIAELILREEAIVQVTASLAAVGAAAAKHKTKFNKAIRALHFLGIIRAGTNNNDAKEIAERAINEILKN